MAVDASVDRRIAALAAASAGQLTWPELERAGLTRAGLRARVARGLLVARGRAVYGFPGSERVAWAAERTALLELGAAAVLSHLTAGRVWGFVDLRSPAPIDVTLVGVRRSPRDGLRLHHVGRLHRQDRARQHGLALTAPGRTILDIAAAAPQAVVEQALDRGRNRRLLSTHEVQAAIARAPNRRGVALLRRVLAGDSATGFTRSSAERLLRQLVADAGLPPPSANAVILGAERDFAWPEQRIVVEIDGYATHSGRRSFEAERARDRELFAAGWRVLRFTWRQLTEQPLLVVATITAALCAAATPRWSAQTTDGARRPG